MLGLQMAAATGGKLIDLGINQLENKVNTARYFNYEEQAAQNAYKRQLAMIREFQTPQAQKRMLENAGLNTSLLYAGNGISGVSGMNAPKGGGAPNQESTKLGLLENALLSAQIDNINADTKVKEQDAENKGAEYENIKETLYEIKARIKNLNTRSRLADFQADFQELLNFEKTQTLDADIQTKMHEAKIAENEAEVIYWKAKTGKAQYTITQEEADVIKETLAARLGKLYAEAGYYNELTRLEEQKLQLKVNEWLTRCDELDWDKEKTDKYLTQEANKLAQELAISNADRAQNADIKNLEHTEHLQNNIVQLITSLLSAGGMYLAGGKISENRALKDKMKEVEAENKWRKRQVQDLEDEYYR